MTESKTPADSKTPKETPVSAKQSHDDDLTAQQRLERDNARPADGAEEKVQAFRGEGGAVHLLAVPLTEVYADQLRRGVLTPVTDDGAATPLERDTERELTLHRADGGDLARRGRYDGPRDASLPGGVTPVERPGRGDSKDAWVDFAVSTTGRPVEEFTGKTKAELIEQVG
jgi:hypothetical protein